jgi:hypothetical protein
VADKPKQRLDMKLIKLMVVTVFAAALLAGPAFAGDKTCCETAKEAGKECTHKCCVDAKKDGKVCEKCNPKKDEKKEEKK